MVRRIARFRNIASAAPRETYNLTRTDGDGDLSHPHQAVLLAATLVTANKRAVNFLCPLNIFAPCLVCFLYGLRGHFVGEAPEGLICMRLRHGIRFEPYGSAGSA